MGFSISDGNISFMNPEAEILKHKMRNTLSIEFIIVTKNNVTFPGRNSLNSISGKYSPEFTDRLTKAPGLQFPCSRIHHEE